MGLYTWRNLIKNQRIVIYHINNVESVLIYIFIEQKVLFYENNDISKRPQTCEW